jgi:3-dehydroquinate dehydratase type I
MPLVRIGRVRIGDSPRLVAAVTAPQRLAHFAEAKAAGADLVELRLDYLARLPEERVVACVRAAARASALPLIATIRSPREGGASRDGFVGDEKKRESLFLSLLPHVHAVDLELSSPILPAVSSAARKAGVTVIVSYHHFLSTPSLTRLRALAQLCKAKGGDIVKIVTVTRSPIEMIRLLSLLHERPSEPLAAFAMGRHALLSRLMAYFFRSCLLYGSLPGRSDAPAAPGIPALAELRDAIRKCHLA